MVSGLQAWEEAGRGVWWGEKSRVSIAADGACASDGLRTCVCVYVFVFVYTRVYGWKTVEEQRETMTETADPAGQMKREKEGGDGKWW